MNTEYIIEWMERIERKLDTIVTQRKQKEFYSTTEIAEIVGRSEFTVREWCRAGRIHATKRACGRGSFQGWMISHQELERFENEGLLPPKY